MHICDYCREQSKIDSQEKKKEYSKVVIRYREIRSDIVPEVKYSKVYNQIQVFVNLSVQSIKNVDESEHKKTQKHNKNQKQKETPTIIEEAPVDIETI